MSGEHWNSFSLAEPLLRLADQEIRMVIRPALLVLVVLGSSLRLQGASLDSFQCRALRFGHATMSGPGLLHRAALSADATAMNRNGGRTA